MDKTQTDKLAYWAFGSRWLFPLDKVVGLPLLPLLLCFPLLLLLLFCFLLPFFLFGDQPLLLSLILFDLVGNV